MGLVCTPDTDWRINAFSVFPCWMVIERFKRRPFTEPDHGYGEKTTDAKAADCHSKLS